MSKKILYIFVEGPDDEKFINAFIKDMNCLTQQYKTIKCIRYGEGWNASKINQYIDKTIQELGHDYIFLADADFGAGVDCFPHRKENLSKIYKLTDINKIWIVVEEIESWFLAGFDEQFCKKEKLDFKKKTEKVTKEVFDKIDKNKKKKSHNQLIDFLIRKKSYFSYSEVTNRNESLARFYSHFGLKC